MCYFVQRKVIILNAHVGLTGWCLRFSNPAASLKGRSFSCPLLKLYRCQFLLESVCVHRKMERREKDEEKKEEKAEGCDDDDTEGHDDDDDETAERSDDDVKEGIKEAKVGGDGQGEASDGYTEQNDGDGENDSVKKKVSTGRASGPGQKCLPGIIYLGHIPPRLRPKHLRNMLSSYGEVGRIFLQPEGREAFYLL